MLSSQHRLKLRELPEFFQRAHREYSPLFVIFWQKNAQPLFQATVIVSKKVSLKATVRNALKRKVRNALFPYCEQDILIQCVVSCHPNIKKASFQEIERELKRAVENITLKSS